MADTMRIVDRHKIILVCTCLRSLPSSSGDHAVLVPSVDDDASGGNPTRPRTLDIRPAQDLSLLLRPS